MRRVFVILGESRSGKSATIRALTGAFRRGILQVATQDGNIDIFVQISALQEAKIRPDGFIDEVNRVEGEPDILVALRPRSTNGGNFPDAMSYIAQFEQEGWSIVGIVFLDSELNALTNALTDELRDRYQHLFVVPNSRYIPANEITPRYIPANEIAHRIRGEWGWL